MCENSYARLSQAQGPSGQTRARFIQTNHRTPYSCRKCSLSALVWPCSKPCARIPKTQTHTPPKSVSDAPEICVAGGTRHVTGHARTRVTAESVVAAVPRRCCRQRARLARSVQPVRAVESSSRRADQARAIRSSTRRGTRRASREASAPSVRAREVSHVGSGATTIPNRMQHQSQQSQPKSGLPEEDTLMILAYG